LKIVNLAVLSVATNIWTEFFILFELTEIMRQKHDKQFAQLFNRLREEKALKMIVIAILKQRLLNVTPETDNYPMNKAHLFTANASVDAHNNVIIYILSLRLLKLRLRLWTR